MNQQNLIHGPYNLILWQVHRLNLHRRASLKEFVPSWITSAHLSASLLSNLICICIAYIHFSKSEGNRQKEETWMEIIYRVLPCSPMDTYKVCTFVLSIPWIRCIWTLKFMCPWANTSPLNSMASVTLPASCSPNLWDLFVLGHPFSQLALRSFLTTTWIQNFHKILDGIILQ